MVYGCTAWPVGPIYPEKEEKTRGKGEVTKHMSVIKSTERKIFLNR